MRLVFLYTEEEGPLKGRELNFVSDHCFHIVNDALVDEGGERLPDGFFNVRGKKAKPVDAVSAIIGENGAGKTFVAEFIQRVFAPKACVDNVIVIFETNGRMQLLQRGLDRISCSDRGIRRLKRVENLKSLAFGKRVFRTLYLSPCYALASRFVGIRPSERFFDRSTAGLLRQVYVSQSESERGAPDAPSPMDILLARESAKMIAVTHRLLRSGRTREELEKLGVRIPTGLNIRLNDRWLVADLEHVVGTVKAGQVPSAGLIRCFLLFALAFIKDSEARCLSPHADTARMRLVRRLREVCSVVVRRKDDAMGQAAIDDFLADSSQDPRGFLTGAKRFFGVLPKALIVYPELFSKRILFQDSAEKDLALITQLATLYTHTLRNPDFITIEFDPQMSSGEMASLSTWGRLYDYLEERSEHRTGNLLIYIDEAETALHPQWQQGFVRNLIWFFDLMATRLKIHVVLASHSPVLLSDVPGGNVCYLPRSADDAGGERLELVRAQRTFAANIYELFRSQYFLQDGPIGAFAKMKIDGVLGKIKSGDGESVELDDDDFRIIRMIGDNPVRHYLSCVAGKRISASDD